MFLPFGRKNGKGTNEMLLLCVERILKMYGVSETCSIVLVSMLMVTPSNIAKMKKHRSREDGCKTCPKEPIVSSNDKETSYNYCT